jgi:DNA-nicking Smr family endonuclease
VKGWKEGAIPSANDKVQEEQVLESSFGEKLIHINIDQGLIQELDDIFGSGELIKNLLAISPTILSKFFIKTSTAKLLYDEIVETFQSHAAEMELKELANDRELARMLQEGEKAEKYPDLYNETSNNLKDIMEQQEAQKNFDNEWQIVDSKPDSLATKLKKEKLYDVFKSYADAKTLDEIFKACTFNVQEFVEVLKITINASPEECKNIDDAIAQKSKFPDNKALCLKDEDELYAEEINNRIENLQEEIDQYCEEQQRCFEKMRVHQGKKEYNTSSYYSTMVQLYKQYCEERRHEVVNLLIEKLKRSSPLEVDLHYFRRHEAIQYVNLFLDCHIQRLRETKKPQVELTIITGRGNHSVNNNPVLKNMTSKLLDSRNLRITPGDNPGIIKVKVHSKSSLSNEIESQQQNAQASDWN